MIAASRWPRVLLMGALVHLVAAAVRAVPLKAAASGGGGGGSVGAPAPTCCTTSSAGCNIVHLDESLQPIQWYTSQQALEAALSGQPFVNYVNSVPASLLTPVGLECQHITAEQLHDQFNRMRAAGFRVVSLVVKDSALSTLSNLPRGAHELKKMVISNTSIDLEVLKEGGESLDQLSTLEITDEKISNIPRNFFQEMQSLKELRLVNDEIATLDGDAFHNLDDSLELLDLRRNRFNRFPIAVKNLAQLAILDLSDNELVIDTQDNDLPDKLEPLLNLRELNMNRINCTCEFSSSPFFEWIARTHITGVRCFAPDKLRKQEVIVFARDEFCTNSSSVSRRRPQPCLQLMLVLMLVLFWCGQVCRRAAVG